ncbi:polymer-forming cytoskeletal protein [Litorimonas sp. RW-G-Af-16]|uniref:bactofilin family protein n=1 Tax=Litorimonas sp. RW-G-Af-16 TaxID=3241168 RepID=UPI00390CCE14
MFNKTNGGKTSGAAPAPADTSKKSSAPAARVPSNTAPSLLGRDLVITGDIKTDGDVQIDGRLDGNVTAGNITIGEQGAVNGKVKGTNVLIRGKVTGKVDAVSVELAETANVQADLTQDQLVIANGAFFDGKCARKTSAPTPITAKKSA